MRGLFIVGADNRATGLGGKPSDFAIYPDIQGMLVRPLCFIPGAPVYETQREQALPFEDFSRHIVRSRETCYHHYSRHVLFGIQKPDNPAEGWQSG